MTTGGKRPLSFAELQDQSIRKAAADATLTLLCIFYFRKEALGALARAPKDFFIDMARRYVFNSVADRMWHWHWQLGQNKHVLDDELDHLSSINDSIRNTEVGTL